MDHTHIIRANDLERYADTIASEALIPELIYLLVKQSVSNLSLCRIPYGEAVNQPGWDGLVEAGDSFLEFVPEGASYWEIGTGAKPQDKATSDFKKRTDALSEINRAKASFVFVTPRSTIWNVEKQLQWRESRKDSGWKQIRIIDGVKLADWLREFPNLGRWMAKNVGITTNLGGISTPREHWDLVIGQDNTDDPPLPASLFTSARTNACDALEAVFNGESQKLFLLAESEIDVDDFVAAYLASLDNERGKVYSNGCLFINDEDAWRSVVEVLQRHVLVASPRLGLDSEHMDLQTVAINKGHAVIIPLCGALSGDNPHIIKLQSPSRQQIESILVEAGYPNVRARELAGIGGEHISALRRYLLGLQSLPPYATWDNARLIAQAGLVGKWDGTNEADREAIGDILGKDYGEWIETLRTDVLRSDSPLMQRDEKWRFVARGEAWNALGSRITDVDLTRFKDIAVKVLSERDPQFDLPKEERYAANFLGKQLKYSNRFREGIAETLALLGSKSRALSSCSQGKAEATAILAVRQILHDAGWERWASLNPQLPLLAEAAPDEFLDAVESVLVNLDQTPFHEIFSQEGSGGFGGWNYMSGLLWALETLAWSPDHLSRVAVILSEISSIDPGGNWANRPANSLADIFLPWHVQTTATFEKRMVAINTVLSEQPDVGWKLLLSLLPHNYATTNGCRQPTWRDYIPKDWKDSVSGTGYWEQVAIYTELLIELAKKNADKLSELIKWLPDLPTPARESVLGHLMSKGIVHLPEIARLHIWENLDGLVRRHRKFTDAKWSLPEEELLKIEEVAKALAPIAPELKYQRLFSNRDFELDQERGNYDEQRKRLDDDRQIAIQEILSKGGLQAAQAFAQTVASPDQVGRVLGIIASDELEQVILTTLLDTTEEVNKWVVAGFIQARNWKLKWTWVDSVLEREWTTAQKANFLALLPFEEEVWRRVESQLGEQYEGLYWRNIMVNPFGMNCDPTEAIKMLLKYQRASAAVSCVYGTTLGSDSKFDVNLATRAMLALLELPSDIKHLEQEQIIEVINKLQESSTADQDALFRIEWNFLPWLGQFSSASPITLENRLASDPAFFAEVVSLVFRSKFDKRDAPEPDEQRRNLASNAYKLLSEWRRCPGIIHNESFNINAFNEWLSEARRITEKTGHGIIGQIYIGKVLTHAPADQNGLWIHEAVAEALNGKDTKEMRSGFTTEISNQRGVHGFTAGKEERELAQQNRDKAEALEAKGFSRFATAMRELANQYERDADLQANRDIFDD